MTETEMEIVAGYHAEAKAALSGGAEIDDPKSRLKTLDEMSRVAKRTTAYLEAYVMTAVFGRTHPARANTRMARLGRRRREAGEEAELLSFEAFLEGALDGVYFTAHGYTTDRLGDHDPKEIYAGIHKLIAQFHDLGYEVFANSGTLLGLVRDKAPIAHDDDIDLAVVLKSNTDVGAAQEFSQLADKLIALGLGDQSLRESGAILKLPKIGGFQVDVFPAYGAWRRYKVFPYSFGDFTRRDVLPLGKCAVSGLPIPANPETVLEVNYGKDWRIPDPRFAFPWGPQKKKFATFLAEWNGEAV
ncbi:hypothetical protein [Yoonia tamlensis]|nr:hypothetical protein [Yoonia tamlensis]